MQYKYANDFPVHGISVYTVIIMSSDAYFGEEASMLGSR
jgi:hypothetical protein